MQGDQGDLHMREHMQGDQVDLDMREHMQGDQGDLDVRGQNIFWQPLSLLSQHLKELTNTHECCHYNENTLSNINIM